MLGFQDNLLIADEAATPIIKLAVDAIPSSAPSTAARSHPTRPLRRSSWPSARSRLALSSAPHGEATGFAFSPLQQFSVQCTGPNTVRILLHVSLCTVLRGSTRPMAGPAFLACCTPRSSCSKSRYSSPSSRRAAVSAVLTLATSSSESSFRTLSRTIFSVRMSLFMVAPIGFVGCVTRGAA